MTGTGTETPVSVGPNLGAPVDITTHRDGRREYRFRQSWINTAMICPERGRLEMIGAMPRRETDATAVGTAVHATFERVIDEFMRKGEWPEVWDILSVFDEEWQYMQDTTEIHWVKRKEKGAANFGARVVERWSRYMIPLLDPFATELAVPRTALYEDDEVILSITGTADYLDSKLGLIDWKTASRTYEEWEYHRWAVQPTVYTYGLAQMVKNGDKSVEGYDGPIDEFTYAVFPDRAKGDIPQVFTVSRGPKEWGWLAEQMLSLLPLIERPESRWPLRDQHALCSEKWCGAWDRCKGRPLRLP